MLDRALRSLAHATVFSMVISGINATAQTVGPGPTDWPSTNYVQSTNRYSPLTQITAENVTSLERVWRINLKPEGFEGRLREDQSIPLVIGDTMYLGPTARSHHAAVSPTGRVTGAARPRSSLGRALAPSIRSRPPTVP